MTRYTILFVILISLLGGCMSARVEQTRELQTAIGQGEAVVVLAKPQIEGASAADAFMDCVAKGLHSLSLIHI